MLNIKQYLNNFICKIAYKKTVIIHGGYVNNQLRKLIVSHSVIYITPRMSAYLIVANMDVGLYYDDHARVRMICCVMHWIPS